MLRPGGQKVKSCKAKVSLSLSFNFFFCVLARNGIGAKVNKSTASRWRRRGMLWIDYGLLRMRRERAWRRRM